MVDWNGGSGILRGLANAAFDGRHFPEIRESQIITETVRSTALRIATGGKACRAEIASYSHGELGNPAKLLSFWAKNNKIHRASIGGDLAQAPGIRENSELKLSGGFFDDKYVIAYVESILNVGRKKENYLSLNPKEARVMAFLHETGHGTGNYAEAAWWFPAWSHGYDRAIPFGEDGANLAEIYEKCFKGKAPIK